MYGVFTYVIKMDDLKSNEFCLERIDRLCILSIKMPFYKDNNTGDFLIITFFYTQIPIYLQIYSLHMYDDMGRTNER